MTYLSGDFFYNAHDLLTIDEAIDTDFTLTEDEAGKSKIISIDAAHVFSKQYFFTMDGLYYVNVFQIHIVPSQ